MELLWRYYEKNRDYAAAAKILNKLADKPRYVCKGLYVCVVQEVRLALLIMEMIFRN